MYSFLCSRCNKIIEATSLITPDMCVDCTKAADMERAWARRTDNFISEFQDEPTDPYTDEERDNAYGCVDKDGFCSNEAGCLCGLC